MMSFARREAEINTLKEVNADLPLLNYWANYKGC
jgi:hypothetical protein